MTDLVMRVCFTLVVTLTTILEAVIDIGYSVQDRVHRLSWKFRRNASRKSK